MSEPSISQRPQQDTRPGAGPDHTQIVRKGGSRLLESEVSEIPRLDGLRTSAIPVLVPLLVEAVFVAGFFAHPPGGERVHRRSSPPVQSSGPGLPRSQSGSAGPGERPNVPRSVNHETS